MSDASNVAVFERLPAMGQLAKILDLSASMASQQMGTDRLWATSAAQRENRV